MTRKPKVVVTRRLPDAVEQRLRTDYDPVFNADDRVLGGEELLKLADGADALLVSPGDPIDAAFIERLQASVKVIATYSVGFDHVDVTAAAHRGIVVTNTPDVLTAATADIAMLLLLGAARRAMEGERALREGRWMRWTPTELLGTDLGGKRLGILGMGRIGQATAKRARGFDMELHYYDQRRLPDDVTHGATYVESPEELLKGSEFLSLHAPSTQETHHFLDARRIELLPQGAIVVNTARGTLVDDEALIDALRRGRVAAAGLDVFENEPNFHRGYLELPNVFLLPHMGSATVETRNAMGFRALDNLDAFFAGTAPRDRVAVS